MPTPGVPEFPWPIFASGSVSVEIKGHRRPCPPPQERKLPWVPTRAPSQEQMTLGDPYPSALLLGPTLPGWSPNKCRLSPKKGLSSGGEGKLCPLLEEGGGGGEPRLSPRLWAGLLGSPGGGGARAPRAPQVAGAAGSAHGPPAAILSLGVAGRAPPAASGGAAAALLPQALGSEAPGVSAPHAAPEECVDMD